MCVCVCVVCFVFRGESPGCRLFGTASMLEWLKISSPTTHRGAVRKDGAEIPRPPLFLIIQWRRQRQLRWSHTHGVVSREINLEKFRPIAGLEPVTLGTKCRVLNR